VSASAITSNVVPNALAAMGTRRLVVVDGQIDDDVLLHGERTGLTGSIADSWRSVSGAIALVWTPADGLRVLEDDERLRIAGLLGNDPARAALGDGPLDRRDPLDVAMALGDLFEQDRERILVVVENAELVAAAGPDPVSRRTSAALLHAVEAFERADELHAFVVVTREPAALPASVTRRSGVASLHLGAPSLEERRVVVRQEFGPSAKGYLDQLAVNTDGFSLRELAMLPDHARASKIDVSQPRDLVASFRHGHREDPWAALTPGRMREIETSIRATVFGQDGAVEEVLERLEVGRSGLELDPPTSGTRKSRLELFLVGPTGVGKNELARALAEAIFGDRGAVMTFDMNAYQQEHSGEQLFGAPPGYVGHDRGSPLVDRLRERPFSVIVFDEIEKAHPNNWLRLMAAIDEGRVTDTRHLQASLENAIVIFTSNIGGAELLRLARERPLSTDDVVAESLRSVKNHLSLSRYELPTGEVKEGLGKPEVWGRLSDSIVAFDLLREDAVGRIVGRFCDTLEESADRARQVELDLDRASIAGAITARLGPPGTWNGRLIKGYVNRLVRRPLARAMRSDDFADATRLQARIYAHGELLVARAGGRVGAALHPGGVTSGV
jgi:hypothetical protein